MHFELRRDLKPHCLVRPGKPTMNLKSLGQTGLTIPEVGLGTWNYHGGVEPLRAGFEQGALLIDTA